MEWRHGPYFWCRRTPYWHLFVLTDPHMWSHLRARTVSDALEPPGCITSYRFVFIAGLRGKMKSRGMNNNECVFLLKTRWTVNGQRKPDWLNSMNPTAVSTRSTSTLQSCLHCHKEKNILCAIGTDQSLNDRHKTGCVFLLVSYTGHTSRALLSETMQHQKERLSFNFLYCSTFCRCFSFLRLPWNWTLLLDSYISARATRESNYCAWLACV